MNLNAFNTLDTASARKELFACCGSTKWTDLMMSHFPFTSEKQLVDLSAKFGMTNVMHQIGANRLHTTPKLAM